VGQLPAQSGGAGHPIRDLRAGPGHAARVAQRAGTRAPAGSGSEGVRRERGLPRAARREPRGGAGQPDAGHHSAEIGWQARRVAPAADEAATRLHAVCDAVGRGSRARREQRCYSPDAPPRLAGAGGRAVASAKRPGATRGRPRDPRVDRAILETAQRLLATGEYLWMSVDDIADAAGVTKPTLYRRLASKE